MVFHVKTTDNALHLNVQLTLTDINTYDCFPGTFCCRLASI